MRCAFMETQRIKNLGWSRIPRPAFFWGLAGILPFAGLTLAQIFGAASDAAMIEQALIAYGALLLTFIGGVHWGLAMRAGIDAQAIRQSAQDWQLYTTGILPSLVGFGAVLTGGVLAFLLLIGGFFALLAYDLRLVRRGVASQWYAPLRIFLTIAVTFCLGLAVSYA